MGRPLKKSFFGSPATGGKQLVLSYVWLEGSVAAEQGYYIMRQVGTGRYQVTNGTKTGVVKLVDVMPDAPGEGIIEITVFGTSTREYASKIHNRTVVTFDGNSYKWSIEAAGEAGEANLPFEDFLTAAEEVTSLTSINATISSSARVTLLDTHRNDYMDSDGIAQWNEILTNGGGRRAAVADGVASWISIFGPFQSNAQAREVIAFQLKTEYNKDGLITAVDAANTAPKLDAALRQWVPLVVADRAEIISIGAASSLTAANAAAVSLTNDSFNTTFKKLNKDFLDGVNTKALSAAIFAARNALGPHKFNGTTNMITAINNAYAAQA